VNERGAAGIAMVGIVGLAMVLSILVADMAGYLTARLQAAAAADAAALAAAPATFGPPGSRTDPSVRAARTAASNGARLVACRCRMDPSWALRRVEVMVSRDVTLILFGSHEVAVSSAAEFEPAALIDG
jgi:hypothetical protein